MSPSALRVVIVAAAFVIFAVAGISQNVPLQASFLDVPVDHPAFSAVEYLREQGLVSGYDDGRFDPMGTINRAEFAKIIVQATIDAEIVAQCPPDVLLFYDVDPREWFYPYLCAAKGYALISGYDDGTFRPANTINTAEALTLIVRAYKIPVTAGDPWYRGAAEALAARGALPLSLSAFSTPLSRGQMAEIMHRLEADIRTEQSHTYESMEAIGLRSAAPAPSTPDAAAMFALVNAVREHRGIPSLRYSEALEIAAASHANDMVSRGYYGHVSPEGFNGEARIRATGYFQCPGCGRWSYRWGENLNEGTSAEDVLRQWIGSQIHNENLMSFNDIGLARAGDYWVAKFGTIIQQ